MSERVTVDLSRAELESLVEHLRESVVAGRHHYAGATLSALDRESAVQVLEAALWACRRAA